MSVILELYDSGGRMYAKPTKKKKFKTIGEAYRYIRKMEKVTGEVMYEGEDYNIDETMGGVF